MTGVWRKCLAHWDKCRQKGQILVFTAVLLPLLIVACGFTVDFGNMYMHKSKLQNAADAAAIAGGYAFRDNKENIDSHPKADNASKDSAKSNLTNFANIGDSTTVSADSIASIVNLGGGKNNIFQNLFSFGSGGFTSTNANQNPDDPGVSLIGNSSFYQGDIRGIGSDANMEKKYTHELLTFASRDAFLADRKLTVRQAIDKDKKNGTHEYYTTPSQDYEHRLDENLKDIVDAAKGHEYIWGHEKKLSDILSQTAHNNSYFYNPSGQDAELKVDCLPKGAPNDNRPLYFVFDKWAKLTITNKVEDRNSRPIIFVYTGTGTIPVEKEDGSYFHGIIYAPYADVHINDEKLSFYGSIASKGLTITGKGTYEIDKTIGGGDGSSTGNGTASTNATVGLTSPPADIAWD